MSKVYFTDWIVRQSLDAVAVVATLVTPAPMLSWFYLFSLRSFSMSLGFFTGLVCVVLMSFTAQAKDWTQWRGPNHTNVAEAGQGVPAEWSETKNVIWKVDVPGRGHASPVITG
ncbi:MAG: hypothetical protein DWI29_01785, partial [Planctomycetota bacterium]